MAATYPEDNKVLLIVTPLRAVGLQAKSFLFSELLKLCKSM